MLLIHLPISSVRREVWCNGNNVERSSRFPFKSAYYSSVCLVKLSRTTKISRHCNRLSN